MLKEIVLPIVALGLAGFSIWIGWKKSIFDFKKPKDKESDRQIVIYGNANDVHISAAEMQKIAYDVNKFDEYHQQSISQCRISFWFSLVFATLGFLIIATSVFTYSEESGYLGIVAGAIVDVVAALFFVQSNKARQLMSDFFDKLRQDRKLEESLKLCESIDDPFFRNSLKLKLSLYFSGLEDSYNIASEIIRLAQGDKTEVSVKPEVANATTSAEPMK